MPVKILDEWYTLVILMLGRQSYGVLGVLRPANLVSLSSSRTNERPCLQNQGVWLDELYSRLFSGLHRHTHTERYMHSHTHEHTHAHTQS